MTGTIPTAWADFGATYRRRHAELVAAIGGPMVGRDGRRRSDLAVAIMIEALAETMALFPGVVRQAGYFREDLGIEEGRLKAAVSGRPLLRRAWLAPFAAWRPQATLDLCRRAAVADRDFVRLAVAEVPGLPPYIAACLVGIDSYTVAEWLRPQRGDIDLGALRARLAGIAARPALVWRPPSAPEPLRRSKPAKADSPYQPTPPRGARVLVDGADGALADGIIARRRRLASGQTHEVRI